MVHRVRRPPLQQEPAASVAPVCWLLCRMSYCAHVGSVPTGPGASPEKWRLLINVDFASHFSVQWMLKPEALAKHFSHKFPTSSLKALPLLCRSPAA